MTLPAAPVSNPGPYPLAWHAPMWQQVTDAVAARRLGHALLLVGSAGVGKRQFAERLARALLCEAACAHDEADKEHGRKHDVTDSNNRSGESFSACGVCPSCRQMAQGAHPGFRCLSLATTDGKQDIPVDAVRGACAGLALTGAAASAKVVLIDRADHLNASGFNALLKTLEEPSARSYMLLISEAPLELPATIRSRCQQLRFPVPSAAQSHEYLALRVPQSSVETRSQALADTLGAPVAAADLLMDESALQRRMQWTAVVEGVLQGTTAPPAVTLPDQRDAALGFSRQIAIFAWRAGREALAQGSDPTPMVRVADSATDCLRRLDSNAQPRLALESLMIASAPPRTASVGHGDRSG